MGIGEYPKEYNYKVHGAYNPGVFYGKRDTRLGDVKLGEMGSWLSRRNFAPQAMAAASSRVWWRWASKYLLVRKMSIAPVVHLIVLTSFVSYFMQYKAHTTHRHTKYH